MASKEVATYTAPDGIKVVSLSEEWKDEEKLKEVYDELCQNFHGDELKLLEAIYLYPEENKGNDSVAGEWIGDTITKDGKVQLDNNATIHIYDCDKLNSIVSIAPILAHEYGHHFTFYYYYKFENKTWDEWKDSNLAEARGITHNPKISDDADEHKWRIQEIVAEDVFLPVSNANLRVAEVKLIQEDLPYQYLFEWDKSPDIIEYTLIWFAEDEDGEISAYPVKTVNSNEVTQAILGSVKSKNKYLYQNVSPGTSYFILHMRDKNNNMRSSEVLAVDFTDDYKPDTVSFKNDTALDRNLLSPHVKINGNQMNFEVPPAIIQGRLLVPLRSIFEELGADLEWDENTQTIKGERWGRNVSLKIGEKEALINGQTIILDASPQIINGRTLVPLRFVSEALGAGVEWNPNLQLAIIEDV